MNRVIKYHVIMANRYLDDEISNVFVVCSASARLAHETAAADYRKKYDLTPNIHIHTVTLASLDTEAEASEYADSLVTNTEEG